MKPQMPPLLRLNSTFYAMEAMNLARRAGLGETPWSSANPEVPLDIEHGRFSLWVCKSRQAATVVAALALAGGLAVASWMA